MNVQSIAESGYMQHAASTKSERRTEYDVLARVTHRLRKAAKNAKRDFPTFVSALNDNRELWRAFSLDVVHKNNKLPQELKARIFYLAEFTDAQTKKILSEKASVLPLLEINVAVMRGLSSEGGKK